MVNLRKAILILLLSLFLSCLVFCIWIHLSYSWYLPVSPDVKTGHVYPLVVNHGFLRYGTEQNMHIFNLIDKSLLVGMVAVGAAMWLNSKYNDFGSYASQKKD
jgi:TRAP-type C4-dicarboxylate transport system permease small subunit